MYDGIIYVVKRLIEIKYFYSNNEDMTGYFPYFIIGSLLEHGLELSVTTYREIVHEICSDIATIMKNACE